MAFFCHPQSSSHCHPEGTRYTNMTTLNKDGVLCIARLLLYCRQAVYIIRILPQVGSQLQLVQNNDCIQKPTYLCGRVRTPIAHAYFPSNVSWVHVGDLPLACYSTCALVLPKGELLVIAGDSEYGLSPISFISTIGGDLSLSIYSEIA